MKLLVIILNKTDVLDYLLEGLSAAGIKGATIIESSGMAMTLSRLDSSFLSASIRGLFSGDEDNRTILSVIKNNQLDTARKIVYNTVGGSISAQYGNNVHRSAGFRRGNSEETRG